MWERGHQPCWSASAIRQQASSIQAQLSGGQQAAGGDCRSLCIGASILLFRCPPSALEPPKWSGKLLEVMKGLAADGHERMVVVTPRWRFAGGAHPRGADVQKGGLSRRLRQAPFYQPQHERSRQFLAQILLTACRSSFVVQRLSKALERASSSAGKLRSGAIHSFLYLHPAQSSEPLVFRYEKVEASSGPPRLTMSRPPWSRAGIMAVTIT